MHLIITVYGGHMDGAKTFSPKCQYHDTWDRGIWYTLYILHILKKGRNMDSKVTKTHRYRENQEKESEREGYRTIYLHLMCMGKHTK